MFFLQIHASYEYKMFKRIAEKTITENMSDKTKILKLKELTHVLLGPPRKSLLLPTEKEKGIIDKHIHSSIIALMGGYACYMHSQVFGALIETSGMDYRNFSMWNNGKNHNVAEVLYNGKWVAIDPLFNQAFYDSKGNLAGKDEIHKHWRYYQKQLGNNCMFKRDDYVYDLDYNYSNTKKVNASGLEFNFKRFVKYIWAITLSYKSLEDFEVDMSLYRYFYWQIILSTLFLFWNLYLLTVWIITKRFAYEKN